MEAQIISQSGRIVTVTFTFDDGTVVNKKMDLQPNDNGDPFDDLQKFFKEYCVAYLAGKNVETNNLPQQDLSGTTFDLNN